MDRSLISHSACLACTLDQSQQPAWVWVISMMGPTFTWSNRYFLRYSGTRVKNDFYHKTVIYFFLIANGNQLCKHFTWLSLLQRKCPIVRNEPPPPSSWLFHMAVHALQQSTVCMPSRIPHGPPAANFGRCRYLKKIYTYKTYLNNIYHLNHTNTHTFKKSSMTEKAPHLYMEKDNNKFDLPAEAVRGSRGTSCW